MNWPDWLSKLRDDMVEAFWLLEWWIRWGLAWEIVSRLERFYYSRRFPFWHLGPEWKPLVVVGVRCADEGVVREIVDIPEEPYIVGAHSIVTLMTPDGTELKFTTEVKPGFAKGDRVVVFLYRPPKQWEEYEDE